MKEVDYGPLTDLIGTWQGVKGTDISPLPDGTETNSYREVIVYTAAGDLENAETQELVALRYHQEVTRISDDKKIHDQTGYWIWDAANDLIMHTFTIPRGVAVLAGGKCRSRKEDSVKVLSVVASVESADWSIVQSPFMRGNAFTKSFSQNLEFSRDHLSYEQMILVDIYGKIFEHTDQNELEKQ